MHTVTLACALLLCWSLQAWAINAADYSVVCDGTTNNATPLQNALNAAGSGSNGVGKMLYMPDGGTCKLNSTVTISNVIGLRIEGNGVKFTWGGNSTTPMFLFQDARESSLRNFAVEASTSQPLKTVVQMENGSGSTITPSNNRLEHGLIECVNGGCEVGVRFAQGAGGDNNNDFNVAEHVSINNVSLACVRIEHGQSKHNMFRHFNCQNNNIGSYVIQTIPRGSFHCDECVGGYSTIADFYLSDATDGISITRGNFEGSKRLLETAGPSGAAFPIMITSTRWAGNQLHADGKAIIYKFRGPLVLLNNLFESTAALSIDFTPGGGNGALTSYGNYFGSTLGNPYSTTQPACSLGNLIDRNNGSGPVVLP